MTSPICSRSKDALEKKGTYAAQIRGKSLVLGYRRETYVRATVITSSGPAKFDRKGLAFKIRVEPQGEWSTDVQVTIPLLGVVGSEAARSKRDLSAGLDRWIRDSPRLECDLGAGTRTPTGRSLVDLAALRFIAAHGRSKQPAGRGAAVVHEPCSAATASSRACRRCPSRPSWRPTTPARARLEAGDAHRRLP
jgi:hypothetical protein